MSLGWAVDTELMMYFLLESSTRSKRLLSSLNEENLCKSNAQYALMTLLKSLNAGYSHAFTLFTNTALTNGCEVTALVLCVTKG